MAKKPKRTGKSRKGGRAQSSATAEAKGKRRARRDRRPVALAFVWWVLLSLTAFAQVPQTTSGNYLGKTFWAAAILCALWNANHVQASVR